MNSIPPFNTAHLLPPYKGEESDNSDLSPYKCSIIEFCERFGTSKERIDILKGLIAFRKRITEENITKGFQWLYGSFTENIELLENRNPKDLDLATFYYGLTKQERISLKERFPEFSSLKKAKKIYKLDHCSFDIAITPEHTVEIVGSFMQVFTHSRSDIWKGIIRLELNTSEEDNKALVSLNNIIL